MMRIGNPIFLTHGSVTNYEIVGKIIETQDNAAADVVHVSVLDTV